MVPDDENTLPRYDGDTETDTFVYLDEPAMFRVILHNDHYTTMDFVVEVLMEIFQKPAAAAMKIMMNVHRHGHGVCGVYTYDIAVTKVNRVHAMAKSRGYPLKSSYERV